MATTPTKPEIDFSPDLPDTGVPAWPREPQPLSAPDLREPKPGRHDALQALLAFSALHDQVRRRRVLAAQHIGFETSAPEFESSELFLLDDVLQLVAERAIAITGADGLAIALAENNEIVLRASAGSVKPDIGARIDRQSAFSGACFRMAQVFRCDDTELDPRVNLRACRKLGARSMVAVPLCGRRRVIGVLEAFSVEPFGFNESDVSHLTLLAELVVGALKPEDEDRFAHSAQVAALELEPPAPAPEPLPVATLSAELPDLPEPQLTEVAQASASTVALESVETILEPPSPETITEPATEEQPAAQEPSLTFGMAPEPSRRPGMLIVAALVLVASLLATGIWWKLHSTKLASSPAPVSSQSSPKEKPPAAPPVAADQPATVPDALSTSASPSNRPATPEELLKFPQVTGVRYWSSADSTTVVLDVQDQVQYEAHRITSPDRIYFDLRDTSLSSDLAGKAIDVGDSLLNRIRVAQPVSGMTRVVLETRDNSNFSVSLEPNPYRLVVQVRKIGANPKTAVNLFPNAVEAEMNKLEIVVPPPTREDMQLKARIPKLRIVVDAGHGGWDLGTVGRRGLLEKDLVLEIARRLGKLLESRLGSEVIYTRQDDNYLPLEERAGVANQAEADLFVSVHANYSDLPSARGVETYYTNFFSSPDARNGSSEGAPKVAPVSLTPVELHAKIEQSRRLAASVQRSLYGTLAAQNPGLRDRGVKEAGFVVLTQTAMPGILAEVSFVSSPTDEQRLRSDGYREQIAEALYRGIARYAATSRVKTASAAK